MIDETLKKLKEDIKNDILSCKTHYYSIFERCDKNNKKYYVIYNDQWPSLDQNLANPDPEGRMVIRNYGPVLSQHLVIYRDVLNEIFKVTNTTFKIFENEDIVIFNKEYRIRVTRNVDIIKQLHKESGQYLLQ